MDNKPHGRDKKVGSGSAGFQRGRRVDTHGPVGGSSQQGHTFSSPDSPQRSGPSRGRGGTALGLMALFAFLPKKLRPFALIAVVLILLFSFLRGGSGGSSYPAVTEAPAYTMPSYSQGGSLSGETASISDSGLPFSLAGSLQGLDLSQLYSGAGSAFSGETPTATSAPASAGGLLQDLPGVSVPATPAPTAAPTPTAKPSVSAAPLTVETRGKRVTPKGNGSDTVTVMVYMCGTDLESKYGMATSDLSEMAKANLSDKVNVIVETGGCRSWKNNIVSNSVNQIYRVRKGGLERLEKSFGQDSMVDPSNLTNFIRYCAKNYPADRNFLILWDHGGGSISGYGYDEKQSRAGSMPLTKINQALDSAGVVFDGIGYDACLMSTLETALVSANYADYLLASEEVEPGTGWYYTDWLNALSRNTSLSTEELGRIIIDSYVTACRQRSSSAQVTLALTDLAQLQSELPPVFRAWSVSTNDMIASDDYRQVSNARAGARQFAESTRINQVDLADLAQRIGSPEGQALSDAIRRCVKYNGTTISRCYGLSIYFPYETMKSVPSAINTYDSLGLDEEYAKVIRSFASLEYGGQTGSAASQQGFPFDTSGYGGYGGLLEALLGGGLSSSGSSSPYGSSSAYGSSPFGALAGSYSNSSGQSSAGYSISASDLSDLLSAFGGLGGRSMPAELDWVDGALIADHAEQIASTLLDPGRITVSTDAQGRKVLSLTPEEWSLVQTVELNVFADDGEGYLDLGLDNTFRFDGDDLLLEFDGTWITVDGRLATYYLVSDTPNGDGTWTTVGRIPARLNGELVNLQVVYDPEHPTGTITGAYPLYEDKSIETFAKGLVPLSDGDKIELLADCYDYQGQYDASYSIGELTVSGAPQLENLLAEGASFLPSYRITDIYGNHYWLAF